MQCFTIIFVADDNYEENVSHTFATYDLYEHAFVLSTEQVCHTCAA